MIFSAGAKHLAFNVRDDREAPLLVGGGMARKMRLIFSAREAIYFYRKCRTGSFKIFLRANQWAVCSILGEAGCLRYPRMQTRVDWIGVSR
jgi:hypothetical protein